MYSRSSAFREIAKEAVTCVLIPEITAGEGGAEAKGVGSSTYLWHWHATTRSSTCVQASLQECGVCMHVWMRDCVSQWRWPVSISHLSELLFLHDASVRHLCVNLSRTQACSWKCSQLQEQSSHLCISCGSNLVWYVFSRKSPAFQLFNNCDHVRGHRADKSHCLHLYDAVWEMAIGSGLKYITLLSASPRYSDQL